MKKILYTTILSLVTLASYSQTSVQAALKPTPSIPNGVSIFLKSTGVSATGKISSLVITFAIPTSVGSRPTIVVDNSPNTSVAYVIQNSPDEVIQAIPHYVYNILGDGDQGPTATNFILAPGVENEAVKVKFIGNVSSSQIKIANIPDGGLGANSFFGFSVFGADRVNETSMFYSVPTISTASNEIIAGGYSGLSLSVTTGSVVLPVKFTSFSAVKKDNDGLLNFVVENETSTTAKYEVERSIDGVTFEKINTLLPANNGASISVYNTVDPNISDNRNTTILYYRVKQIGTDGRISYSEIRTIRLIDKAGFSAFPNPTKDFTTVRVDAENAGEVLLTLLSAEGKQILSTTMQTQKGINLKKIDMSPLTSGNYIIKAEINGESKTISVIKL